MKCVDVVFPFGVCACGYVNVVFPFGLRFTAECVNAAMASGTLRLAIGHIRGSGIWPPPSHGVRRLQALLEGAPSEYTSNCAAEYTSNCTSNRVMD